MKEQNIPSGLDLDQTKLNRCRQCGIKSEPIDPDGEPDEIGGFIRQEQLVQAQKLNNVEEDKPVDHLQN